MLKKWEQLPENMQTDEVRKYYDILKTKQRSLFFKRLFDIVVSAVMLVILLPLMIVNAIAVKIDSSGPVFFRQVRVTQYGREFRILKFRTMVNHADKLGTQVTVGNDNRVTRVGRFLRDYRLDELPQIINVMFGDMTYVGVRPEIPKYVEEYKPVMLATLLLPGGVTSEASIMYKDESQLLSESSNVDKTYVEGALPGKMYYNLRALENFSLWGDIVVMLKTVFVVLGKEYSDSIDYEKPPFVIQ